MSIDIIKKCKFDGKELIPSNLELISICPKCKVYYPKYKFIEEDD